MYLDELKYDLVDVRNYAFSKDFHTLQDLSKRFPVYKDYFEQYFGAVFGTRLDAEIPNYMLWSKAEGDFSTDPITLHNIFTNVINPPKTGFGDINYNSKYAEFFQVFPFNNLSPSQRKVFGEVWEKNTEFSLDKPNERPNQEPFIEYAKQKLEQITPLAQQQIKFLSPSGVAAEQFVVNGVPYTATKFTLANTDASTGSTPRAFIEARDQSGKKVNFTFIPETYLTKGQKIGDKTYMNTNFLNQDFLSNLNGFTLLNRNFDQQFIGQYINDTRQVYDNSAVSQFVKTFGANGFLINSSDLSNKFSGISSSLSQAQFSLDDARLSANDIRPRDIELVSFAGQLAYKTTGYITYQRQSYISTGFGGPILVPHTFDNVGMDAYITGKWHGQGFSYDLVGPGYTTKSGYLIYDTVRLMPKTEANWGAFIAGAAGLFLAGSGLASAIAAASGAATTTSFATAVGQAIGLTGTAASVAGGAIVGASIYSIAGQDPLKGAVLGGIGELASVGTYAEPVGRALGATTTSAAVIVGNIAISSALSGLRAVVLGEDVGKSMLAGGVVGGFNAASADIASALVGGTDNLQAIANNLGFYGVRGIEQVQSIISNSIAQGIVSEISGAQGFGEAVAKSLVSNGLSTKVANAVVSEFEMNSQTTKAIFQATQQLTAVALTASLNNQDVSEALAYAAPGIVLTSFRTLTTPDQKVLEEVAKEQVLEDTDESGFTQINPVAPPDEVVNQDLLDQIQDVANRPDIGLPSDATELASGDQFRVQGAPEVVVTPDGSFLRYYKSEDGSVQLIEQDEKYFIVENRVPREVSVKEASDFLANLPKGGSPFAPSEVPQPPSFSILFNYLTEGGGSPYAPNRAVFDMEGGLGTGGGSTETIFKLITIDQSTGKETYDVGGKLYTLVLLPSFKKQVLVPQEPTEKIIYIDPSQFDKPRLVETSIERIPPEEAKELIKEIEKTEQTGEPAGGMPEGAEGTEGAAGGLTGQPAEAQPSVPGTPAPEPAPAPPPAQQTPESNTFGSYWDLSQPAWNNDRPLSEFEKFLIVNDPNMFYQLQSQRRAQQELQQRIAQQQQLIAQQQQEQLERERQAQQEQLQRELQERLQLEQARLDQERRYQEYLASLRPTEQPQVQIPPSTDSEATTPTETPGLPTQDGEISDDDLLRIIEEELGTPGEGEGEGAPGEEGDGLGEGEEGEGPGTGEEGDGQGAGEEGDGTGAGGEGTGIGGGIGTGEGEGEGGTPEAQKPEDAIFVRPSVIGIRRPPTRAGEAAPYRVTGMDESGILGRKQPLFGGDEDLQRAEWNRRSLRLRRLLGL